MSRQKSKSPQNVSQIRPLCKIYIKRPVGTPVGTPPQHHHSIRFKEPRIHIHTLDFPHLLLHRNGAILFHLSVAVFCHDSPAGGNHSWCKFLLLFLQRRYHQRDDRARPCRAPRGSNRSQYHLFNVGDRCSVSQIRRAFVLWVHALHRGIAYRGNVHWCVPQLDQISVFDRQQRCGNVASRS